MIPYLIIVIICSVCCFFPLKEWVLITPLKKKRITIKNWYFVALLLIIFAGCRGDGSGDYWEYLYRGAAIKNFINIFHNDIHMDYGYCMLAYLINKLHLPAQVIIVSMNIISITCISKTVNDYSKMPFFSLLVFMPFFFQYDMHAARTACAIGIFSLAYKYSLERKFAKFILVLLFSVLFHKEAVIGILLYFLPLVNIDLYSGIIILSVDLLFAIFNWTDKVFISILDIVGADGMMFSYLAYSTDTNSMLYGYKAKLYDPRYIIAFLLFVYACYAFKNKKNEEMQLLKNASFVALFIMILFNNHTFMVYRFSSFYTIFQILMIPTLFPSIQQCEINEVCSCKFIVSRKINYVIMVLFLTLFAVAFALRMSVPYKIFALYYWDFLL